MIILLLVKKEILLNLMLIFLVIRLYSLIVKIVV